jgi:uncharacterized protein (TIGR03643 family)
MDTLVTYVQMFMFTCPDGLCVTRLQTGSAGRFQSFRIPAMLRAMAAVRKQPPFPAALREEIIKLAWADAVPFETIFIEYGLTENQVRAFMRRWQSPKTYARWRARVEKRSGRNSKHARLSTTTRFHVKA